MDVLLRIGDMTAAYQHRPTVDIAVVPRRQNGGAALTKRWFFFRGLKKFQKQFLKAKSHIFRGEKLKGAMSRGSLFLFFLSYCMYCTVLSPPDLKL